jgi:hypothetical protein
VATDNISHCSSQAILFQKVGKVMPWDDLFAAICPTFHRKLLTDGGFAFTPIRSFVGPKALPNL